MDALPLILANIVPIVLAIVIIVAILAGIKTVPQGYNFTVERFRRYRRTLKPGLNLLVPFLDRVGARVSMMEQVLDVPSQEVITRDNATITVDGVVFYQVLDAAKAAYEVMGLENAILNLTMTNIRTVMGSMDLDELLSNRDVINQRLLDVVDDATQPWGVKMTRIEIKDIEPPRDLVEAMGRQMKAERLKRASILESEGLRQSAILSAEGQKQARILDAEGLKEAAFRDAEARERMAEADAKATELLADAIGKGGAQAINYFVAEKYLETLQALASAPNQKVLIMPLDATAAMGALAGVAEIAKEAFNGSPPSKSNDGDGETYDGFGSAVRPSGTVPPVSAEPALRDR